MDFNVTTQMLGMIISRASSTFKVLSIFNFQQGGHALWKTGKTGKMVKKNFLQGKIREFEILLKIKEKSGNFRKSYLCKVKIFKFYSCSDVATRGGWRPYILPVLILTTMKVN